MPLPFSFINTHVMQSKLILFALLSAFLYALTAFFGKDLQTQMMISLPWILCLGIPHGAVDHILYKEASTLSVPLFYGFYLLAMIVFAAIWFVLPQFALGFFLLLSAFHFGESQFGGYSSLSSSSRKIISFLWGVLILASLFSFHTAELKEIVALGSDVAAMEPVLLSSVFQPLALISFIVVVGLLLYFYLQSGLTLGQVVHETICLILTLSAFYYLPLLIAFACYFTILHSLRMLEDEFELLKETGIVYSVTDFMLKLLPMTLLSICGLIILVVAISEGLLQVTIAFLSIMLIALITLPHSVVMHALYQRNLFSRDHSDQD